jgi:HrpA-like RNA helicase
VGEVKEGDSRLPVVRYREEILEAVRRHATVVVVGETGSGKSTQLPQFLADALLQGRLFPRTTATNNNSAHSSSNKSAIPTTDEASKGKNKPSLSRPSGIVACTQPRRVAAVTVAKRVASERGGKVGDEVGYAIRFDDCSSSRTRIKYLTDGVLLREAMVDPMLTKYSVIVLDEAHERSLQTDILMGLLKQLQALRPDDLKVVVMSATLEAHTFIGFFKVHILQHIVFSSLSELLIITTCFRTPCLSRFVVVSIQ